MLLTNKPFLNNKKNCLEVVVMQCSFSDEQFDDNLVNKFYEVRKQNAYF